MTVIQTLFGLGRLFSFPSASSSTPAEFGVMQDISLDMSFDEKMLYGQNQFPVKIFRGKGKIGIKAKTAQLKAALFNQIFFGGTLASGQITVAKDESHAVPTTPFQVQVTNYATFVHDLGVMLVKSGVYSIMKRVADSPAAGQYSVDEATGTYTFSSADNVSVGTAKINYSYTSGSGNKITITNQPMGTTPTFGLQLTNTTEGQDFNVIFPMCTSSKLALPLKQDDAGIPEFDISAMDDGNGIVAYVGTVL